MKRLSVVLLVFACLLFICGCSKTSVNADVDVTLTFVYADENICVALEDGEAEDAPYCCQVEAQWLMKNPCIFFDGVIY